MALVSHLINFTKIFQILEAVRDVDREDLANQVESVMSKMEDKNATQTTVM